MAFFDDFLRSKVATEDQAILAKYPELKASFETLESQRDQAVTHSSKWNNWYTENWDSQAGMTRRERELQDALVMAQQRVSDAAASGADQGTIDGLKAEMSAKLDAIQKSSEQQINGMNYFYESVTRNALKHQQEFGEVMDPAKLREFIVQNKFTDPDLAYGQWVSGKRQEISAQKEKDRETQHAADIAAAEQRGREQQAREAAMGPGGFLPTDHSGGIVGISARIDKPAEPSDAVKAAVAGAKLGSGELARLGYEAYVRGELPVQ